MKLKQRVRRFRPDKKIHPVLFLLVQDKARPHTSLHTGEGIESVRWSLLPHGTFIPDIAPSDFHLFGCLKEAFRGRRFAKYDELKHGVCVKSSDVAGKSFKHLTQRRKKLIRKDTFVGK